MTSLGFFKQVQTFNGLSVGVRDVEQALAELTEMEARSAILFHEFRVSAHTSTSAFSQMLWPQNRLQKLQKKTKRIAQRLCGPRFWA